MSPAQDTPGYRADLDELAGLVDRMRRFDARARELADQLSSSQRELSANWTGVAAQHAAAAHERWSVGYEQVRAALGSLAGFVRTARANYLAAAETNTAMWR
jgi:WXG100 family type VII secretion target